MQDIDRLLAIHDIMRLKAKYCRVMDERNWDEWRDVFTEDAVMLVPEVKIRPRVDGVEAIIEFVSSILAGAVSVHQLHAPEIEIISADAGRGIWALHDRLIWPTGHPGPLGGTKFDGSGHYHEVYRRTAKGWRIAELRLSRLYTERA